MRLLLITFVLLVYGCATGPKPTRISKPPATDAVFRPKGELGKPVAQVPLKLVPPTLPVLPLVARGELPEGYSFGPGERGLEVAPAFPSPVAPHRVIGSVWGQGLQDDVAAFSAKVSDFAHEQGATAFCAEGGRLWLLAPSTATPVFPPAASFWERADRSFKIDGATAKDTVAVTLDAFRPVVVKLGKQECLAFELALEPDANFTAKPWQTVLMPPAVQFATRTTYKWGGYVVTRTIDGKESPFAPRELPNTPVRPRNFGQFVGCTTSQAATWSLKLTQVDGNALGIGAAKLRLYVLKPSEATVAAECARCKAYVRTRGSWSFSDLNRCMPRPLTADVCE